MWYILNQVHSTRLLPKSYFPLVQNCKNLRRIPVLRVPSWLVCGLDPVHLRTRSLCFFAAVIYYRISKTTSILVSLKSNKFPSSSFLQRKGKTVCWFALGNIQKVSFLFFLIFFLFALYVTLFYGLPLTGWLSRTSDCWSFKTFFSLSTRTQLINMSWDTSILSHSKKKEKNSLPKSLANQR